MTAQASSTTPSTAGTRGILQCRRRCTSGASRNETSTASVRGMKISRAMRSTATAITKVTKVAPAKRVFERFRVTCRNIPRKNAGFRWSNTPTARVHASTCPRAEPPGDALKREHQRKLKLELQPRRRYQKSVPAELENTVAALGLDRKSV